MTNQINPLWTAYNNAMNEGGEGFNPHEKFVSVGGGEPLWSKLDDKAYRLQNRLNGMSDYDMDRAKVEAEYKMVRAAAADALARNI